MRTDVSRTMQSSLIVVLEFHSMPCEVLYIQKGCLGNQIQGVSQSVLNKFIKIEDDESYVPSNKISKLSPSRHRDFFSASRVFPVD